MYFARVEHLTADGPQARIVATDSPDGEWVDVRTAERLRLERAGASADAAARIAAAVVPSSMTAAIECGPAFLAAARAATSDAIPGEQLEESGRTLVPIDPPAYRDFMVFERHFSFGYEWRGLAVPDVLYEFPISYFGNVHAFHGPDDEIPWPHYSEHMDYELELGIVIGRAGRDLLPEQALDHVFGLTILNDFSARDIQRREMAGGLGPSKGKHFACAAGPWIATLDELRFDDLRMRARVNGELWSDATSAEMLWSIAEVVAWASAAESLAAGTLLGSGTANGGSAIELGRRLGPGDVVELEIEGLGILSNRLGAPGDGWMPTPRPRAGGEGA